MQEPKEPEPALPDATEAWPTRLPGSRWEPLWCKEAMATATTEHHHVIIRQAGRLKQKRSLRRKKNRRHPSWHPAVP